MSGEQPRPSRPVGKTRDAGWQIGVTRTVPASVEAVWQLLTSPSGVELWLAEGVTLPSEVGAAYEAPDGTRGELRSYRHHDRIRLTWQPPDWDHESTVQVALTPIGDKTTLRLHQERLADADERERQRDHWQQVAERLAQALGDG